MYLLLLTLATAHAQNCPKGQIWINAHPRNAYVKQDETQVSATSVTSHCRSKSKAYDFWNKRFKNGPANGWTPLGEVSKLWSREELELVLKALEKVPFWLWKPVTIHRYSKSNISNNPASTSGESIVLYDETFSEEKQLSRIMAHELSHLKYNDLDDFERTAISQGLGWQKTSDKNGKPVQRKNTKSVLHDSDLSPEEDFANVVESFLFEPLRLKTKAPATYDWLEAEYGDKLKPGAND